MLRAALVTPLSGPLARYGRAGAEALALWAEGFTGRQAVRVVAYDAHPDPSAAVGRAEGEGFDLLFGPYGSSPAAAAARATSRLMWNHGGAQMDPVRTVVSVLAPASSYFAGAVEAVHTADPAVATVAVLHSRTGFGREVGAGAEHAAIRLGLQVQRTTLPVASAAGPPEADLLLVAGGFDDELAAARRLLPGRWRAAGFVGAGVEEVLAALGPRRERLLGPAQWLASAAPDPDEGPPAAEFAEAFRRRTGGEPPYPAAQAFAAGLIAARCLREAGDTRADALLAAARRLDCTTLFGRFRLDPETGRQVGQQMLTVQWQDDARIVVWPQDRAQAPLRHPLRPL
jgi:branched-chain amino acid transport system substrate-binding protein